jgi:NAD(P)-dependent dehydrogenase (short-subunit alcohol dehydrogenase family)
MSSGRTILVTGATGYVGGRLVFALLERDEHVRCLARRPDAVAPRPGLEVVGGNALDAATVRRALDGVDAAYYLIHAMGGAEAFQIFEQEDRKKIYREMDEADFENAERLIDRLFSHKVWEDPNPELNDLRYDNAEALVATAIRPGWNQSGKRGTCSKIRALLGQGARRRGTEQTPAAHSREGHARQRRARFHHPARGLLALLPVRRGSGVGKAGATGLEPAFPYRQGQAS